MSDSILEPPGSIAVVGAGPLGIEAALYGRYLGYNVRLVEATSVGSSLASSAEQPLPMLPDRCLSPLAVSAINAQSPDSPAYTLPTTIGQWIETALIPLTQSDLLSGRLLCPARVTRIDHVTIESDAGEDDEVDDEEVPPDFRLTIEGQDPVDVEAVILAVGDASKIELGFGESSDYLFRVGEKSSGDAETDFLVGLKQIVSIYAELADRESLDLYAPKLPPAASS